MADRGSCGSSTQKNDPGVGFTSIERNRAVVAMHMACSIARRSAYPTRSRGGGEAVRRQRDEALTPAPSSITPHNLTGSRFRATEIRAGCEVERPQDPARNCSMMRNARRLPDGTDRPARTRAGARVCRCPLRTILRHLRRLDHGQVDIAAGCWRAPAPAVCHRRRNSSRQQPCWWRCRQLLREAPAWPTSVSFSRVLAQRNPMEWYGEGGRGALTYGRWGRPRRGSPSPAGLTQRTMRFVVP